MNGDKGRTTVRFMAQYLPVRGRVWEDLAMCDTTESAAAAIRNGIVDWHLGSPAAQKYRPLLYRIIRREVTEVVVAEATDDLGVESAEEVRAALLAHAEAWHGELVPLEPEMAAKAVKALEGEPGKTPHQ